MGPPLGHVRDPHKQSRFVEAELSALLQAAGGTLPVIKKDSRGVFVMETSAAPHAPAKPAAAPTAAAPKPDQPAAAKPAAAPASKAPAEKAGANPDRNLNKRYTYAGVADTGPVSGETFEQKVARLKAVAVAAKQRSDEGGGQPAAAAAPDAPVVAKVLESAMIPPESDSEAAPAAAPVAPPNTAGAAADHKPTGEADRSLMLRSTYCGVAAEDTVRKLRRLHRFQSRQPKRSQASALIQNSFPIRLLCVIRKICG